MRNSKKFCVSFFTFCLDFWHSCRREEKLVIAVCAAILIYCAGGEWARRQRVLPPLFVDVQQKP
jgi:hypothetical protein